ncbi:MAPEG family protein [Pseudaminobacter sp. 19-2017]|uniref:MAPEG family protein n=1 Tax=Pseudaminobacter soli (ex Zhang et al. 2022) TaxID=2831468 RepID=A0A942DVR7_9HYPH|nr:MAPEG family protein [Pseudaminobacter soli]MBS3647939.1 MAPEG family protein [Pseudaminobacter soli]
MEAVTASTEIVVLACSVVLLLVQVVLQAVSTYDLGPKYLLGPRDERRQSPNLIAGRLERALRNLLETYPAFVALALALVVTGDTGGIGAAGAWVWLAARVVYLVLYAAGVPVLRTLTWLVSVAGLLMMLFRLIA